MNDRRPTMDDLDLTEFALFVALGGVAVGAAIGLAVWLLPWLLAIVVGTAIPGAASLGLKWCVDRWWRMHSVPEPNQTDREEGQSA